MGRFGVRLIAVALLAVSAIAVGCGDDVGAAGAMGSASISAGTRAPNGPTCGGERPKKATGGLYACTFTDDFAGTALDTGNWLTQETWYSGVTTANGGCFVNTPNNISVSGGAVHLTARVEAEPFVCKSPYGDFTTQTTVATIATRSHFAQTYGRFEFRAKFPNTTVAGAHSALWLYPAKLTYGAWPNSGEIDVAEWFSGKYDHVYPSVHYQGEPKPYSSGANCVVPDPWNYHRYAVEWTTTSMRFLYDGIECFRHSWTPDAPLVAPQPFDKPFYLVLSQGFGASWNAPTDATPKVVTMDVDWARAWR